MMKKNRFLSTIIISVVMAFLFAPMLVNAALAVKAISQDSFVMHQPTST